MQRLTGSLPPPERVSSFAQHQTGTPEFRARTEQPFRSVMPACLFIGCNDQNHIALWSDAAALQEKQAHQVNYAETFQIKSAATEDIAIAHGRGEWSGVRLPRARIGWYDIGMAQQ